MAQPAPQRTSLALFLAVLSAPQLAAQVWTRLQPAQSPQPRLYHTMAYDEARDRVVLFGGFDRVVFTSVFNDTWEFDGTTWANVTPVNSPPGRRYHAMCYDCARGRMILHGGDDGTAALNDTWEYDGTNWQQTALTTAPTLRYGASMAYDAARARTVLFGGAAGTGNSWPLGDTWEYDGAQWLQATPLTSPPPRKGATLCYDTARARLVMSGGLGLLANPGNLNLNIELGDCWTYDGSTWTIANAPPVPRCYHAMAYDRVRGRTVLFGGSGGWLQGGHGGGSSPILREETWTFDGASWTEVTPRPGPGGRYAHAVAFDSRRGRLLQFGGYNYTTLFGDTWEWQPAPVASSTRYGIGCAGSTGTPQLDAGLPRLGTTVSFLLSGLAPQPGVVALLLGFDLVSWGSQLLPVNVDHTRPHCLLWLSASTSATLLSVHTGTTASIPLAIPANPVLSGLVAGTQALSLDTGVAAGFALSNGAILQLR